MAKKVERTKPGSRNDWRITYNSGSQKWTDDKPGDGKGESLKDNVKDPSISRGLKSIFNAIKNDKDLKESVNGLVRDIGTEKSKSVLSDVIMDVKKGKAPKGLVDGWNKAKSLVEGLNGKSEILERGEAPLLLTLSCP